MPIHVSRPTTTLVRGFARISILIKSLVGYPCAVSMGRFNRVRKHNGGNIE